MSSSSLLGNSPRFSSATCTCVATNTNDILAPIGRSNINSTGAKRRKTPAHNVSLIQLEHLSIDKQRNWLGPRHLGISFSRCFITFITVPRICLASGGSASSGGSPDHLQIAVLLERIKSICKPASRGSFVSGRGLRIVMALASKSNPATIGHLVRPSFFACLWQVLVPEALMSHCTQELAC